MKTSKTFRFGDEVMIRRGGHVSPAYGSFRQVKATYLGANGKNVLCRLEQDDPNGGSPNLKGELGWWSRSAMTKEW